MNFNHSVEGDFVEVLMVERTHDNARLPTWGSELAAGMDLYADHAAIVAPEKPCVVQTGIKVAVPDGCYGRIAPRSGLAANHCIGVMAGVIDADYRGEINVLLCNHGKDAYTLLRGDRVAQLIIERISRPEIMETLHLPGTDRGDDGFGSTGR